MTCRCGRRGSDGAPLGCHHDDADGPEGCTCTATEACALCLTALGEAEAGWRGWADATGGLAADAIATRNTERVA